VNSAPLFAEQVQRFRTDLAGLVGSRPVRLGIAVSGGPDSLALLLLAKAAFGGAPRAATVDHGLRAEAAAEADFVHHLCERLGIGHDILRPDFPITGNLQSKAREARYFLLERWRQAYELEWVATAHHSDDQAETLLMRMNRGSGIAGLSGVRKVTGKIIRPLLGWRRAELEQIVATAGLEAVDDPSNVDERFDRARLRRHLRSADWIDPLAFSRSAAALAQGEEALEWMAGRLWSERAQVAQDSIRLAVADLPAELRRRLVRRALETIYPGREFRGGDLTGFIAALEAGGAATLAGVKGEGGNLWRLALAPPRRPLKKRELDQRE
jgi:tRNA(Ile)-lysidine synthase